MTVQQLTIYFLYKNVDEIKTMIDKSGLNIIQDIALKATDLRVKNIGIVQTVNYAAIIEKRNESSKFKVSSYWCSG